MKSVEFCYWLMGQFELSNPATFDSRQTDLIRRHLDMVFIHEIDGKPAAPNKPADPPKQLFENGARC